MQVGKRYWCDACGTEVLVTRAGNGEPYCCDRAMVLGKPKDLPSAD